MKPTPENPTPAQESNDKDHGDEIAQPKPETKNDIDEAEKPVEPVECIVERGRQMGF